MRQVVKGEHESTGNERNVTGKAGGVYRHLIAIFLMFIGGDN